MIAENVLHRKVERSSHLGWLGRPARRAEDKGVVRMEDPKLPRMRPSSAAMLVVWCSFVRRLEVVLSSIDSAGCVKSSAQVVVA
jgi:hypothetical protein